MCVCVFVWINVCSELRQDWMDGLRDLSVNAVQPPSPWSRPPPPKEKGNPNSYGMRVMDMLWQVSLLSLSLTVT